MINQTKHRKYEAFELRILDDELREEVVSYFKKNTGGYEHNTGYNSLYDVEGVLKSIDIPSRDSILYEEHSIRKSKDETLKKYGALLILNKDNWKQTLKDNNLFF